MADKRLSRLQKFILKDLHGDYDQPLDLAFRYWSFFGKDSELNFKWGEEADWRGYRANNKYAVSLRRSVRNLEHKGLVHVGKDRERTIRLTDAGKFIAESLPPTFPKYKAKKTIRPLKFRPPRVPTEGSGPNPGPEQIGARLALLAKGLDWLTDQCRQLERDRKFWGDAAFRWALDECLQFRGAIASFMLAFKHFGSESEEGPENNIKVLNAHGPKPNKDCANGLEVAAHDQSASIGEE